MPVHAGELRNRITVYAYETTRTETGSTRTTWIHKLTLWASFEPLSVRDKMTAAAAGSEITARCKVRYRDDLTHGMRIEHMRRMYEMDGDPLPDTNSGKEYMTLALRGVSHG